MNRLVGLLREYRWPLCLLVVGLVVLASLLLYRLGSLVGGVSIQEQHTATAVYGWHGLYRNPLYLPLNALRSIIFKLMGHHGQTLTRIPNALFDALTVICFGCLLWFWYGMRTAIFGTILFGTCAWTLHVSRLATNDIMYLIAIPVLLLISLGLHKRSTNVFIFYGSMILWGILLYIPGMVWFILLNCIWLRKHIINGWKFYYAWWQRCVYCLAGIIWLPLLGTYVRYIHNLITWLGFPQHFKVNGELAKQFIAVPLHITLRGPEYPWLWLGKAPLLDVFTLVAAIIGIYFYAMHYQANRSRLLASYFAIGWILITLNGPVSLSLLVPIVYLCVATGVAYLIREWLHVFPTNPIARGIGIGLIVIAVGLSSIYNMRAYFIAWAHDPTTKKTFIIRR